MNPASPTTFPSPGADGLGRFAWETCLACVQRQIAHHGWHPSRVVVLVPYAQMMEPGRKAWACTAPTGFPPRFESTRNWATSLAPFAQGHTDLSGDTARDSLIAATLLDRVAGRALDPELRASLVDRLLQAGRQLAPLAAARHPNERAAWAQALRGELVPASQSLQWEGLVASLALTWVGLSAYATDVLWSDLAEPGRVADGLLLLPGFQDDPLALALLARWGRRGAVCQGDSGPVAGPLAWGHACTDAEDEAQRAAACVIREVNDGLVPVALVAQDRALTRRIGAMLQGAGLVVRDETGWKLSTTHAAARLLALLRAADRRARTDDVLDWLKQGPRVPDLALVERLARDHGLARWSAVQLHAQTGPLVPPGVSELLAGLQAPRPLVQWLQDLSTALQQDGWWIACQADAAGQRVIDVLRLREGAAHELDALQGEVELRQGRSGGRNWTLGALVTWVRNALEAASFQPETVGEPQVVVLPMAQLLGRRCGAVVAPGCDEVNLPPSPEPPGQWSEPQRALLGLPGREELARAAQAAWAHLLTLPRVQLLWRSQHQGDAVAAAPWVQAVQGTTAFQAGIDPRVGRVLSVLPRTEPRPVAADLLPQALSASAFQDLRDCPYRFFALRQLRLQQVDEIEAEPDKRDLGNWLHAVLRAFHEARAADPDDGQDDRLRLDALAQAEALSRGLSAESGEGGAGFLPFLAAWPAMRDGYLAWLADHEAGGPRFDCAEVSLDRRIGPWRLIGQLDRIDRQPSPEGPIALVIDYKTEPRQTTLDRVKRPLEDTQVAFYAALLDEETVRGAYLSITDSREADSRNPPTRWVEQEDIALARDHLLDGIQRDLARIADGHALPAFGEGRVCNFCAARGLCRKDFKA